MINDLLANRECIGWLQGDEHIQLQLALLSMYSVPEGKGKVGEHKEHYTRGALYVELLLNHSIY